MSGIILPIRCVIASLTTIILVGVARGLYYFGLRADMLDILISPWATFIIFMFAIGLIIWPFMRNIKLAVPIVLATIGVAVILTFVSCQLPLPW